MRSERSSATMALSSDDVVHKPRNRGIRLKRMRIDTTIAAVASASSEVTKSPSSATAAAMTTAILRRVSAKTCCGDVMAVRTIGKQFVVVRHEKESV